LTVGEVWDDACFSVYLIPETMRVTLFGFKGEGDTVNIEIEAQTQAIVETVERVVQQHLAKLGLGAASGAAHTAGLAAAAAAAAAAGGTV
jgi:riboflavin synthase